MAISIKKPEIEQVKYRSSVFTLNKKEVTYINEKTKIINLKDDAAYKIGDILIIPTLMPETDIYIDIAYKIEDINGNIIKFSIPELNEVYSKLEISNTYSASSVKAFDNEQIQEQILNNSEIDALSKALYDLGHSSYKSSGMISLQNTKLVPDKVVITFKSLDPLNVLVNIVWKINDDLKFSLSLQYQKTTTVSFYSDENEKRQTTTESGKWIISAELKYDIYSPDVKDLFGGIRLRNKYTQNLNDSYEADKQLKTIEEKLKNPNLTDEEREKLNLNKQIAQTSVDYANLDKKFLEMENKKAIMLQLKTIMNYYKSQMDESTSVIKFVQLFFPVFPGAAFVVESGVVLDFSVSASLEGKLVIDSIQEIGTVSAKNKQIDFNNTYYRISGYFGISGKIELKIGGQIGVGVTIAGVFNLKLTFEGGLYAELSAIGAIFIGDTGDLGLSEEAYALAAEAELIGPVKVAGAINYDIGSYYLLKCTVSLDLWVTEITQSFEIVGDKNSFIKQNKEEIFQELVFENETIDQTFDELINKTDIALSKGNTNDSTAVFEIDNSTGSVTLPNIYLRTIDLKSGKITHELINTDQLNYINQDQVYFNGLTCYVNDYYANEIDNRLNIRLNTEEETLAELILPIRIIKLPIAVGSISLRLFDNSNEIGLTESKLIKAEILPYNATYQNYRYSIEKIEKQDGTLYSGDLTQYAVIENNILTAINKIAIGAKIYISATTDNDQVKSNVLVIEVKRIGIDKIDFYVPGQRNDINLGEELSLVIKIYPSNATINILNDSPINVMLNDSTLAVLTKINDRNYKLAALDNLDNEGKIITLTVMAENYSKNYFYQICSIPIESIVIYNSDTNSPLENDITLFRNNTLNLSAVITPVNASVNQARFNISSDIQNFGRFVNIDSSGKLIISDDAPFGMILYLSTTALRKSSGSYKITVNQIPVESVMLSSEKSYIIKNSIIFLNAYIYPENADISVTQFKIINGAQGVFLSGNMLFASANAVVDSEIELIAIVNGIESNILSIRIINNPDVPIVPKEDETPDDEFVYESDSNSEFDVDDE